MREIKDQYACDRAKEMISYMYNEMASGQRDSFETHLSKCTNCTDEFALLADARFSIFEWHKEEFAELPTPVFTIPIAKHAEVPNGFLTGIAAAIRGFGWAIPAAAVLLLSIGFISYFLAVKNADIELAASPVALPTVARSESPEPTFSEVIDPVQDESKTDKQEDRVPREVSRKPTVAKASKSKPSISRSAKFAKQPVQRTTKPVLSSYEDVEDRSLRLSDLLGEVGG